MRNTAFRRRMQRLALVAMLLLSCLPTLGRLAGTPAVPGASAAAGGVWAQICTIAGLKLVKIAPGDAAPLAFDRTALDQHASGELGAPPPAHGDGMSPGQDCGYCPLLASLLAVLLWAMLALPQPVHRARNRACPVPCWKFRHPSGLGSRGPPLPL